MKKRIREKIAKRPFTAAGTRVWIGPRRYRKRGRTSLQRHTCLIENFVSDEIMHLSGCEGEFLRDFEIKCRRNGCPMCGGLE